MDNKEKGKRMMFWTIVIMLLAGLYIFNQYMFSRSELLYPPAGKTVTVEGIRLHYIEQGSGIPVVFLHGGVLAGSDFEQVMELAASRGYRAISFDRPGYGYSERPQNEQVTPMDQARLLHLALKKIGVEKPILVGHSWSGILVLAYALNYPNEVEGIVTLGGGMYKQAYPAESGDPISKLVTTPAIGNIVLHTLLRTVGPFMADSILKATFAPEPVPPDYRKATLALWLRPLHFKSNREDVLSFVPAAEQISPRYGEIKTPAVIVIGENDPFTTKDHSYWLHDDLPYSKLVELPDVAHMIPHNHPKAVVDAVQLLHRTTVGK